ncbi:MAG: oligosaccharide flippase family protein [Dehalococcoidia bacterium]|nr:oligosaccharide flippase family protein [Dehalococcoidia bacterium]
MAAPAPHGGCDGYQRRLAGIGPDESPGRVRSPQRSGLVTASTGRPPDSVRLSTAGSIASGFAGQGFLVVSGALAARLLGIEDRGQLALLALFPAVLAQIGGLGLPAAATYFIARERSAAPLVARLLIAPALIQALILTVLHAAIVMVLWPGDGPALLTLPLVPALLAAQYALSIIQGQGRLRTFNIARLLPVATYAVAMAIAFALSPADLGAIIAFWVAANVAAALIGVRLALVGLGPVRELSAASVDRRQLISFGVKGFLGWASPLEAFRLDQAAVGLFLSPASLGLYVVASAWTNLPRFVAQGIGQVAYPHIASRPTPGAALGSLWRFFAVTTTACAAVVVVLELVVGSLLPLFFGSEFEDAVGIARLLLVAALFQSARRILGDGARGAGRPQLASIAEISSWIFLLPALAAASTAGGLEPVALALIGSSGLSLGVLFAMLALPDQAVESVERRVMTLLAGSLDLAWAASRFAVASGLAVAVGVVTVLVSPELDHALIAAIGVLLLVPMAQRFATRTFDIFEPLTIFTVAYGLMFVARPIAVLVTDSTALARPGGPTYLLEPGYTQMLVVALIGLVGFQAGYLCGPGRRLAASLRLPNLGWHADTAIAAALVFALAGIALFGLFVWQAGGVEVVRSLWSGRDPSQSELFRASTGYFYQGTFLLVPATLLLLATGADRKKLGPILLAACLGALVLMRAGPTGGRMLLLLLAGSLITYAYLRTGKRPGAMAVLAFLVVVFVALTFLRDARTQAVREDQGLASVFAASVTQPGDGIESFLLGADTQMADALAVAVQVVPEEQGYRYGGATMGDALTRPIPRVLWDDKPLPPREQLISSLWPTHYQLGLANPEFSVLAWFYLDLGVAGVLVGTLVMGVLFRAVFELYRRQSASAVVQALYASLVPVMVIALRDSPTDTFIRMSFVALPLLITIFLARETPRGRDSAALPGAQGARA